MTPDVDGNGFREAAIVYHDAANDASNVHLRVLASRVRRSALGDQEFEVVNFWVEED